MNLKTLLSIISQLLNLFKTGLTNAFRIVLEIFDNFMFGSLVFSVIWSKFSRLQKYIFIDAYSYNLGTIFRNN